MAARSEPVGGRVRGGRPSHRCPAARVPVPSTVVWAVGCGTRNVQGRPQVLQAGSCQVVRTTVPPWAMCSLDQVLQHPPASRAGAGGAMARVPVAGTSAAGRRRGTPRRSSTRSTRYLRRQHTSRPLLLLQRPPRTLPPPRPRPPGGHSPPRHTPDRARHSPNSPLGQHRAGPAKAPTTRRPRGVRSEHWAREAAGGQARRRETQRAGRCHPNRTAAGRLRFLVRALDDPRRPCRSCDSCLWAKG